MSTELSIRPDQTSFDSNQLAALRSLGVQNASDADVALFFHQAARTGLDPFARQIYLINRGGKQTIQVGIDGFRLIRDRKGNYQGHTEEWCGPDGKWRDVWLDSKPPAAARVSVYVKGYVHPVVGIALWSEYAQMGRDGKPQALWASKPALMLAKCAEALALRKAYPQDLSGLYTSDELPEAEQDADGVHVVTTMRSTAPKTQARPGGSRPTSKPAAGPADTTTNHVTADRSVIAGEWIERINATDELGSVKSRTGLYGLRDDADRLHILGHVAADGITVDGHFLRRRNELQQRDAALTEPDVEETDADFEDSVPF